MKKFTYLLVAMFIAFGASAQVLSSKKITTEPLPQKAEVDVHFDGDPYTAIGTDSEAQFTVMARFTADELADYYGSNSIKKVKFAVTTTDTETGAVVATEARILIYGNGTATEPGQLLVDEPAGTLENGWNEFTLPTVLPLESGDYWVGYEVKAASGFPAVCDAGPMVSGKGGWIWSESITEGVWHELSSFGLSFNWNIRATLSDETGIETEIGHSLNAFGGNGIITINYADAATAQIFNVAGQLVNSVNLSKSTTVEVPAGVYVVRVGNAVQKVLVK